MIPKFVQQFQRTIKPSSKGLILAHENADLDAIGSAMGMRTLLGVKWRIAVPSKANEAALFWCANNDVALLERPLLDEYSHLVVVDFSGFEMAGPLQDDLQRFSGPLIVIDHHQPSAVAPIRAKYSFIDAKQSSCSQIIANWVREKKIKLDARTARALLAGIVWDTGKFARSDAQTFELVSFLLQHAKQSYTQLLSSMTPRHDVSDRVAKIKSLQRAQLWVHDTALLSISHVSRFQSQCADQLIASGCDIAIVAGFPSPNALQASFRASEFMTREYDFNFVQHLIEPLMNETAGQGGGHAGAAGFRMTGSSAEDFAQRCIAIIEQSLTQKTGKKWLFKKSD